MPQTSDTMTVSEMAAWAKLVGGFDKVQVAQAWSDLLLHKRHITIRRA